MDKQSNSKWIRFEELTPNPGTKRWAVMPKDGSGQIGMVKWYGPWRKYCFFPMPETVFEQDCLRDVAAFCESETASHRKSRTVIKEHEKKHQSCGTCGGNRPSEEVG